MYRYSHLPKDENERDSFFHDQRIIMSSKIFWVFFYVVLWKKSFKLVLKLFLIVAWNEYSIHSIE